jgi:hypothetical protein
MQFFCAMKNIKTTDLGLAAIAVAVLAAGIAIAGMPPAEAQLSEVVAEVEETVTEEEQYLGHTVTEVGELIAGEE